jgi:hypothetical protein
MTMTPNVITKELHIATVVTDGYKHISKYFFDSITNDHRIKLHVANIDVTNYNGVATFRTPGWYHVCKNKVMHLLHTMRAYPHIDYIILSDADVQYFNKETLFEIVRDAKIKNLDFYGMREDNKQEFNTGWYIIRNNGLMKDVLESVINTLQTETPPFADQTVINHLIFHDDKFNIAYEFIPRGAYIWGNGKPQSSHVAFHHAVATDDKVKQLERIRNLYLQKAWE